MAKLNEVDPNSARQRQPWLHEVPPVSKATWYNRRRTPAPDPVLEGIKVSGVGITAKDGHIARDTLLAIMANEATLPAVRVQAARIVLSFAAKEKTATFKAGKKALAQQEAGAPSTSPVWGDDLLSRVAPILKN